MGARPFSDVRYRALGRYNMLVEDIARARFSQRPGFGTFHKGAAMLKWKILAVLGVAFGVAGIGWGYAEQGTAPGFYELRVYTALPEKRDPRAERFASRTAA